MAGRYYCPPFDCVVIHVGFGVDEVDAGCKFGIFLRKGGFRYSHLLSNLLHVRK